MLWKRGAEAVIAQETFDSALDKLRALQTGVNSPAVQTAAKAVDQGTGTTRSGKYQRLRCPGAP